MPALHKSVLKPSTRVENALVSKNLVFQMTKLPKNCALVFHDEDGNIEETFGIAPASDVLHPLGDPNATIPKVDLKLILPENGASGIIKPIVFMKQSRRWELPDIGDYCVEGFHVNVRSNPKPYEGHENNYAVIYCEKDVEEGSEWIPWMYFLISVIAMLFLVAIIAVYVALWKQHNLHGLTILSYTIATLGSYYFLAVAHLVSLFPHSLGVLYGLFQRGFMCYANGKFKYLHIFLRWWQINVVK